jgi:hypothetical protein
MPDDPANTSTEASEWLARAIERREEVFVKRLSANDTGATGGHQVGVYMPGSVIKVLWPKFERLGRQKNPKFTFPVAYRSHKAEISEVTVTWYNNALFGGTRNEYRITGWGGRGSPIQDERNTGAVCVLAFAAAGGSVEGCEAWVCRDADEEESIEAMLGPVEPGGGGLVSKLEPVTGRCALTRGEMPAAWREDFPKPDDLVQQAIVRCGSSARTPDARLIARRDCEFSLFESVERVLVLPKIRSGFKTVDEFLALAGEVTNRRKSRSGRSLELHLAKVFKEEKVDCSHGAVSEGKKRPDFLFPSADAYHNKGFSEGQLRMLAVKTTVKDRWRQILNEAHRIKRKHLLTLQQGVSVEQFAEMHEANVTLVVPQPLHRSYPKPIRKRLVTLATFVREVRGLC